MVRLCMTQSMVEAVRYCESHEVMGWPAKIIDGEPPLDAPEIGKPISHGQVVELSIALKDHFKKSALVDSTAQIRYKLADLLRGSQVYIDPPKPKPEQTNEYKTLMARLRKEEEARAYERMMNPPPPSLRELRGIPVPLIGAQETQEEDEFTYADINRQVAAIFNVLLSVVACSVAIWMAARHWSTPSRLGLSMGGGGLVGVAEVVLYAGYLRRVLESKQEERKKVERKVIVDTWSTQEKLQEPKPVPVAAEDQIHESDGLRHRSRPAAE